MKARRNVFIGGKQIGVDCLRHLIRTGVQPALVVANPDDTGADTWHSSLVRVARGAKIPVITKKKVRDPAVVRRIRAAKPDIIFAIGSTQIIPKDVLAVPPLGVVNIHPALLPKYRGRFSTAHAIFNGEHETGVTLHLMDEGMDSGPIISQRAYAITDDDTAKTVYDTFTRIGTELFKELISSFKKGDPINATPQDERNATYYPKGLPGGGEIDWSWDGATIRRFIRAMTFEPFPPASFMLGTTKMTIAPKAAPTKTPRARTQASRTRITRQSAKRSV